MPTFDRPLVRPSLHQSAWIGSTAIALLCLPPGDVRIYGLTLPAPVLAGVVAAAVVYPALSCFCAHTIRQHVVLLDAHLKERFDQDARDALCLFDDRRQAARSRLRRFSGDMVRTAKQVGHIRDSLTAAATLCLALAAAGLWLLLWRASLNGAASAALLIEAAFLLLRCERRIGRELAQPGPTETDQDELDHDIAACDSLEREMLLGVRSRRVLAGP